MYIDAHCHVDRYPHPGEILRAAERARVVTIAVTETPSDFQALTVKAGTRDMLRVALGLHPLRVGTLSRLELTLFRRMLNRTDYVGEVGLDFSPQGRPTRARQLEVFEQILAEPDLRHKVLTVHSRGAERDTVRLLIDAGAHAILHWYTGALKHLDAALNAGMWFSVNAAMLRSKNGLRILAALPPERVVTESDGPYTKHNGRQNDPSTIPSLVEALAALWNEDPEATRERVFNNMKQIHASIASQNGAETSTLTQTLFEAPVSVKAASVDTKAASNGDTGRPRRKKISMTHRIESLVAPDFTRFARKPSERVAIVEYIYATPNLQETDYLEWKAGYDLSKRPGAAATARQLIGMANRDTAHAMRHADGHAYVLLGVEPGSLSGVPEWDSADIEKWLTPFVGPDIRYDAHYVRVEGQPGQVLFLAIDPPREGDPIYNLLRSSQDPVTSKSLDAGTIYVRHGSNTAPAKPDDLKRLSARLATSSSEHHLAIEVQPSRETVLRRLDVCKEAIEGYARGRYNELLGTRWSQKNSSIQSITAFKGMMGESRTQERFEQEVESYRKALEEKLPDVLHARSVAHNFNLLPLSIVNNTNGTFAGVKVELWIPDALGICVWKRERSDDLHPPVEPIPYGDKTMMSELSHGPYIALHTPGLTSLIEPHWTPTYQETDGCFHVSFMDEEVRAEEHRTLPDIWLMLDHEAADKLSIRWEATAKEAKGRLSGEMTIPLAEGLVRVADLLADVDPEGE